MKWLLALLVGSIFSKAEVKAVETVGPVELANNDVDRFDATIQKAASTWGVPWKYLKAFAMTETWNGARWAPSMLRGIENPRDTEGSASDDRLSWGLMQMRITTAQDYLEDATPEDLNSPSVAADLAAQHIAFLFKLFPLVDPRYVEWVVKSYNQGQGNTDKERNGARGYADAYWERWQRNFERIG